jgi:hypothetical protein
MSEKIPRATHTGELHIGKVTIPCAVLEDGTRVLTQEGFLIAIGRSGKPAAGRGSSLEKVAPFLEAQNLEPFINDDLRRSSTPIRFRSPKGGGLGGNIAFGYPAELLPKVCDVFLEADEKGKILHGQKHILAQAKILIRGLAHVGIIALVDEATGYQADRGRRALEEILEKFISKELLKWAKMFPDEFYEQVFRLRGLTYDGVITKRPPYLGHLTNDIVYERLAPYVLDELKKLTPKDNKGRRKHKYFQRLTEHVGHPRLREHLAAVIALMKASSTWRRFYGMIQRALPKYGDTPEFPSMPEPEDRSKANERTQTMRTPWALESK